MDADIAQTIVNTVERYIRPTGCEHVGNRLMYGAAQAAKMTAGMLLEMSKEFVPFEGLAKAALGREVEPEVSYILPRILRQLLTLKAFVDALTTTSYTTALVIASALIDRIAKEKNWSPECTDAVKASVRMAIPMVAYIVMVSFSGIAKLGDEAMGKLAHKVADPYLQRLKDWWNPKRAIEPAATEPATTDTVSGDSPCAATAQTV